MYVKFRTNIDSIVSTSRSHTAVLVMVVSRTPHSLRKSLVNLPNNALAVPMRSETSPSTIALCDIVLPSCMNLSVTFSGLLSTVMAGAE